MNRSKQIRILGGVNVLHTTPSLGKHATWAFQSRTAGVEYSKWMRAGAAARTKRRKTAKASRQRNRTK